MTMTQVDPWQEIFKGNAPVVRSICTMTRLLDVEQLKSMRDNINRLHTIGPLVDPTGYMNAMPNIPGYLKFIDALIEFHGVMSEMLEEPIR